MLMSVVQRPVLEVDLSSDGTLKCDTLGFVNEFELCPGICVIHVNDACVGSIFIHLGSLQSIALDPSDGNATRSLCPVSLSATSHELRFVN